MKPGKGSDESPDAGNAPGTAPKAVFEDANLEKAREKGAELDNDLKKAILNDLGQPKKKNIRDLGYKPASKEVYQEDSASYLSDLGIRIQEGAKWKNRAIWREDSVSKPSASILLTSTDVTQGVIIIKQSWKDRDQAVPKASWTDLVHDAWIDENTRKVVDLGKIRYVARDKFNFNRPQTAKGLNLIHHPPSMPCLRS